MLLPMICPQGKSEIYWQAIAAAVVCALVCSVAGASTQFAEVDTRRLVHADSEPGSWMSHGRTYSEQRFSQLDQISAKNIDRLGLAWEFPTSSKRGLETTPVFADGILYFTGTWSVVFAVDARTGRQLWKWDPQVERRWARKLCCDVVNRGVALWKGRVYAGTLAEAG